MGITRKWVLTDLELNSNKYWGFTAEEMKNGVLSVRFGWGRVKEDGSYSSGITKAMTQSQLDSKIRSQEKDGYREVKMGQSVVVASGSIDFSTSVGQLVKMLMEQANRSIYSYLATDLGSISVEQMAEARLILDEMRGFPSQSLVQRFYTTIPTQLPRRINVSDVVRSFDIVEQRNRIAQIESAIRSKEAVKVHGSMVDLIGAEIEEIPESHPDFEWVIRKSKMRDKSDPISHNIRVRNVYSVRIPSERGRFLSSIGNVERLFHGTSIGNVAHILNGGLKVELSKSGYFGFGIYGADYMGKSCSYSSQTVGYGSPQVMLLCDFALGNQYVSEYGNGYRAAPEGYNSVWGKKGHSKIHGRGLHQNEFIVYRNEQVTITHLIIGSWN